MQINYKVLAGNQNWFVDNPLTRSAIPSNLNGLVVDKGSLTKSLINLSDDTFEVTVLSQKLTLPYFHEQKKLIKPLYHWSMVREVELKIHDEAVVFARSIIPLSLIKNKQNGLANLGQKPLGHLLFRYGQTHISKREYAYLRTDKAAVYARRTPYQYQGSTILVSEFFLPALDKYLDQ